VSTPRGPWWSPEQTSAALAARQEAADAAQAGLGLVGDALRVRAAADFPELDGLSAESIQAMSMESYREIRRRAGLPEQDPYSDAYADFEPPGTPRTVSAPEAVQANADMSIDIASLSMADYAQLRGQLGVNGREYGVGITSQGGGTDAWVQAARAKSGRAAMNESGVQQAPQIDGSKYLTKNEPVQGRQSWYRGA
jgi:hypothetical protein